jgi:hypothetical protein
MADHADDAKPMSDDDIERHRAWLDPRLVARVEADAARIAKLRQALREVKLLALTAGAPGEIAMPAALSRMVRLCLDADISERISELRAAIRA